MSSEDDDWGGVSSESEEESDFDEVLIMIYIGFQFNLQKYYSLINFPFTSLSPRLRSIKHNSPTANLIDFLSSLGAAQEEGSNQNENNYNYS
jgi:hypothetical protein